MISRVRRWQYGTPGPVLGYSIAVLLAAAAQVARIPLHSPTLMPRISYVPFVVLSAALGGFGPGLFTTGICILESMYFATEPLGTFTVGDSRLWGGLGALAFTGLVTCTLFDSLKRALHANAAAAASEAQLARELETRQRILESIIEHSPAAMALLRGPEFTFAMVNPAHEAMLPGALVGTTIASVWRAGAPLVIPIEAWLPLSAGGQDPLQRCLLVSTTVMKVDRARKVLVCAQDITERKRAEVELARQHDELQRQAALIDFSHDAIITADANRVIRGWNRGAEEMYGWTEAEAVGNVIHHLLRTSAVLSMAQVEEVVSREGQWEGELEHSRDDRRILVESRQVRVCNTDGNDIRILEINRDITQRRRAEDALNQTVRQLESALAEKTVLLQEIHHRVKNNLAVTASLLSMKADSCGPETRLALEESRQRVHSIALVHEHLYGNDRLDRINFGEYARELVQGVYSAFAREQSRIGLDLELDAVEVGIERAVPCALILNELLSNAFKYAFADGRTGRILVSFSQPEPGCCELAVEDDGVGLPAGALSGQHKSLGLRIVGILTNQLDGSVEQKACAGTRIVLRFPAAA